MADDNTLSIRVTADVSALQSRLSTASEGVEAFYMRARAAEAAYNAASQSTIDIQRILGAAYDAAAAAGASYTERLESAVAAVSQYNESLQIAQQTQISQVASSAEEIGNLQILTAAQRQYAEATLQAVTARKALTASIAANVGRTDLTSVSSVAANQTASIAAMEQLALAKQNLAEVQAYVAQTAAQEAAAIEASAGVSEESIGAVTTLEEAYAKLDAEMIAVQRSLLAQTEGAVSVDAQVGEVSDLTAAYNQLAEATLEAAAAKQALSDATKTFAGSTETIAVTEVAAAMKRNQEATEQLVLAKRNLAEVQQYSADAAAQEAAALTAEASAEDSATASTVAHSAALSEDTAAARSNISGNLAAQGALRTLEGSMFGASRAAGSFLTEVLGLGPVLELAFPIIGAVALGSILVDVGENLYDMEQKANEATDAIGREFDVANQKLEVTKDGIDLTNSKLQDQIDKLEHHPSNGLQTALLEAVAAADKLQESLNADNEALEGLLKKHEINFLHAIFSGKAPTSGLDKQIEDEHQKLTDATTLITAQYDESVRAAAGNPDKMTAALDARTAAVGAAYDRYIATLKTKLDAQYDLQRKNNEAQKINTPRVGIGGVPMSSAVPDINYAPGIRTLEQEVAQAQIQRATTLASMQTEPLQAKIGVLEQQELGQQKVDKAAEQHLRMLEAIFAQEEQQYGVSANQTEAYWDQYLNTFKQGSSESLAVMEKVVRAQEEMGKRQPQTELERSIKKAAEEATKDATEHIKAIEEMKAAGANLIAVEQQEQTRTTAGVAEQAHQQNAGAIQTQEVKVEDSQALGVIDPTKALEQLRSLHQQAIAEDERYITQEIAIYAKEPEKVQQLQKQLAAVHQKGLEEELRDTEKILQQEERLWKSAYQTMTNDLNETLNKFITSTQKPAQAFARMFDQILAQLATFVEKWIEKKVELWIEDEAAQASGQAASKTLSLGQIQQAAATAAANTYAAISAIPIIGPVLAPPAAAAAYAAVLAFEAFEAGGIVSGMSGMPVPIMAHAGERVLNTMQTQNFEKLVNQPAPAARSAPSVNYSPTINAFDRTGFRSTLQAHQDDIVDIVRKAWNTGSLSR